MHRNPDPTWRDLLTTVALVLLLAAAMACPEEGIPCVHHGGREHAVQTMTEVCE